MFVNVAQNLSAGTVARAGFSRSGVSRNNRLIERHETAFGSYWKSYDFAGNADRQNLFSHPLGPDGEDTFMHDGGEIIFSLPNGLQGYMLVDAAGARIDKGPTNIVVDSRQGDKAVVNGLSCMSCHAKGMIEKADEIREHVRRQEDAFEQDELDSIDDLYPPAATLANLFQEDAKRFATAVAKTGAPLSETEPIVALALRFEQPLDLDLAAAETGVSREALTNVLKSSPRLGRELGSLTIEGGLVQRDTFVATFPRLVAGLRLGTYLGNRDSNSVSDAPSLSVPSVKGTVPKLSFTNSIGMKFVLIPKGEFIMGSPESETDHGGDERQHRVRLSKPFHMGIYEVTQEQYQAVMGANPSNFSASGAGRDQVRRLDTKQFSVEQVSWEDAQEFCRRLSTMPKEQSAKRTYRLPTEAEWEYACRAKTTTSFHFGETLGSDQANFNGATVSRTTQVGSYPPNAFGLFDMHGNVWEWCQDFIGEFPDVETAVDPTGPASGRPRVIRGGAWSTGAGSCRSACRGSTPSILHPFLGFRVVAVRYSTPR